MKPAIEVAREYYGHQETGIAQCFADKPCWQCKELAALLERERWDAKVEALGWARKQFMTIDINGRSRIDTEIDRLRAARCQFGTTFCATKTRRGKRSGPKSRPFRPG
jgi:hypothetical protein